MRRAGAALGLVMLLAAGCAGSGASPTVRPTLHLASFGAPAPVDSLAPDESAGVVPSGSEPTLQESLPPVRAGAFPDVDEQQLLARLGPAVRATCQRAGPFYAGERASVSCGDGAKIPFVYYTLFGDADSMEAGYATDLAQADPPPAAAGTCSNGRYEHDYVVGGRPAGRVWCGTGTSAGSSFKLIEWTRDSLLTIGLITSYDLSWDVIEQFWRADAAPR